MQPKAQTGIVLNSKTLMKCKLTIGEWSVIVFGYNYKETRVKPPNTAAGKISSIGQVEITG